MKNTKALDINNLIKNNNQKGSITLFVLVAVLFFLIISFTAYSSSTSKLQSQELEFAKIKSNYENSYTDEQIKDEYNNKIFNSDIIAPTAPTILVSSGTKGQNGWYVSDVVVKIIQGTDNESGVNKTTYILDGAMSESETDIESGNTLKISEEGETAITAYTYDKAGNKSEGTTITIKKDSIAPDAPTIETAYKIYYGSNFSMTYGNYTTFQYITSGEHVGQVYCENNGDVRVDFTNTSKLKGIKGVNMSLGELSKDTTIQVFYSTGSGYSETNSVRKSVSKGNVYVYIPIPQANYTSIRIDIGTNTETYYIGSIDLVANEGQENANLIRTILSNNDTQGSGFWKYQYKTESGSWTDTESIQTNSTAGTYNMYYRVVDKAGNISATKSVVIKKTQ